MSDPVPDDEVLFRFIDSGNWVDDPVAGKRISSGLFYTRECVVSVNRGSIWSEAKHHQVCPQNHGFCSLIAGPVRLAAPGLEFEPEPLSWDPLLEIPNPSHTNFSRRLSKTEARRLREMAQSRIHREPPPPAEGI